MWRHPEITTVPDIARYWARSKPDKQALLDGALTLNYAELNDFSSQVAHAMTAELKPGTPVAFLGRNCAEFWVLWFGCGKSGRPFVPLNWRLAPPELAALLEDSGAGLVVVEDEQVDQVQRALALMDQPPELKSLAPEGRGGAGLRGWANRFPIDDPAVQVYGHEIGVSRHRCG